MWGAGVHGNKTGGGEGVPPTHAERGGPTPPSDFLLHTMYRRASTGIGGRAYGSRGAGTPPGPGGMGWGYLCSTGKGDYPPSAVFSIRVRFIIKSQSPVENAGYRQFLHVGINIPLF